MPKLLLALIISMLAGCATKAVVMPIDEGAYLASQEHMISVPLARAAVLEKATKFCEDNGQELQPLKTTSVSRTLVQLPAALLQFRCVDKQ